MVNAQEQSTKGSCFYQPFLALPQAIHIEEYIYLQKENYISAEKVYIWNIPVNFVCYKQH